MSVKGANEGCFGIVQFFFYYEARGVPNLYSSDVVIPKVKNGLAIFADVRAKHRRIN